MHRWIEVSRRASRRAALALADHPLADLGRRLERGEGGDVTMVVDELAEGAILAELEELGTGLTAISEERGRVEMAGGGPPFVVIDPVDGSLNAKRGLPSHGVSIAVASSGERMSDVDVGFVLDLASGEEWWALKDGGAFRGGARLPQLQARESLEIIGLETARPELIAEHADWIAALPVSRVRALGSVALSMCLVAAGALDAMASLRAVRSVDVAAAQLIVKEAGGRVVFPDAGEDPGLGLDMRSRVVAAGPGAGEGLRLP